MALFRVPFPPRANGDLRTSLYRWTVSRAMAGLIAGERRREESLAGDDFESHLRRVRQSVRSAFGDIPFGKTGGPLELTAVSQFDAQQCRIENVLFDSYPGWRVNASVFIPRTAGPHPAVVIPVGHSGKQFQNYQVPAQAFAALGFVAVLFDPPGQASEKQPGNDHFRDGVRSFLLGETPNRYFVLDALRCIDYLETRDDVDLSRGVGMTGVSGGGVTTLFASVLDDRIACFGPSCCLAKMIDHPVGDSYSECPEKYWHRRVADGVDSVDVALASFPRPMLYMAGRDDEVFTVESARVLADTCRSAYERLGEAERFAYFEDSCGHAYSLRQVARFAAWMRRWIGGESDPDDDELDPASFRMLDYEYVRCHPPAEENMFTLAREASRRIVAARTGVERSRLDVIAAVSRLIGNVQPLSSWVESTAFRVWMQDHSEALAMVDDLEFPVTLYRPHDDPAPAVQVVVVDDRGRTASIEAGGLAQQLSCMTDRERVGRIPGVAVPDLPGWGDTRPALVPYAAASWGSMDRFLTYLSYGLGDGPLAVKARCLVSLAAELRGQGAAPRLVLVGRGLGGVVAALAAALIDDVAGIVLYDSLASFGHLLEADRYVWPAEAFLPNAVKEIDLPELLAAMAAGGVPVSVLNPRDGMGAAVPREVWSDACPSDTVLVAGDVTDREAAAVVRGMVESAMQAYGGSHDES